MLLQYSHRLGYALWKIGKKDEAQPYFRNQIEYSTKIIELGRYLSSNYFAHYDLAGTYAFLGDKINAYFYLKELTKLEFVSLWMANMIMNDPLFVHLKGEEEFQKIANILKSKNQTGHDRVGKWLEENDML